jgi:hypothetical protein
MTARALTRFSTDPRTEPAGRPREQGRRASVKPAGIGDNDLDRLHRLRSLSQRIPTGWLDCTAPTLAY